MEKTELEVEVKVGRPPDPIKSERVRLDGYRKRGVDPRHDVTFAWLDSLPAGTRFGMAWELLTAALNGELGDRVKQAVTSGNTEEAMDALQDLIGAFS
jgi:hypothetical protein